MLDTRKPTVGRGELSKRGAVAVVVSVVANIVLLQAVVGTGLVRRFEPLNVPRVAIFSAIGALGATVSYAVVDSLSGSPEGTFTVVAAVALVLSFVPDVALLYMDPGATVPGVVVLMVMHVVVAVASVASLTSHVV